MALVAGASLRRDLRTRFVGVWQASWRIFSLQIINMVGTHKLIIVVIADVVGNDMLIFEITVIKALFVNTDRSESRGRSFRQDCGGIRRCAHRCASGRRLKRDSVCQTRNDRRKLGESVERSTTLNVCSRLLDHLLYFTSRYSVSAAHCWSLALVLRVDQPVMGLANVGEEIPEKELIQIVLGNLATISWSSFKSV